MACSLIGGSWASTNLDGYIDIEEEGVGPPLRVGLDQLWASLGPLLTYMFMPGVQNVKSMGAKV